MTMVVPRHAPSEQTPFGDTNRRHRIDTLLTTFAGLGVYGLALLTSPLLARALGPEDRGSLAAVVRPTELVAWLLMFGLPLATAYRANDADARALNATAWAFTLFVGVPVVGALWFVVPAFLANHPPEAVTWFRWGLGAALFMLPFQNTYELLRASGQTAKFNLYRSLPIAASTVGIVVLYCFGSLTLERALAVSIGAAAIVPASVVMIEGTHVLRVWRWFSWELARVQLHYGARVWFGTLSSLVLARFDQLLMVTLVSRRELGLYAVAATGAMVTAPIAQGVGLTLFPYLRSESNPRRRAWRTVIALRWTGWASVLGSLLLAVTAPWLLPAMMGEEFRDAVPAFLLLLPGQLCWNIGQVYKAKLESDNRPGVASAALGVGALLTLICVPFAVDRYGIEGAAAVTSITQAVFVGICWFRCRHLHAEMRRPIRTKEMHR